jgi:hypothetical protein
VNVAFHQRVAVMSSSGLHLRYVHAAMATALVTNGDAQPETRAGRVRAVTLARPAQYHAERIGEPSAPSLGGVKFTRWRRLEESGTRVIEHHPRSTYE